MLILLYSERTLEHVKIDVLVHMLGVLLLFVLILHGFNLQELETMIFVSFALLH